MLRLPGQFFSKFVRTYCSVNILEGGKKLQVPSCSELGYHVLWLRQNCQCEACLSSSNQKTVTAHNLKGNQKIRHAAVEGINNGERMLMHYKVLPLTLAIDDRLHIEWSSDDSALNHTGQISLQWLKDNCYSPTSLKKRLNEIEPKYATKVGFY